MPSPPQAGMNERQARFEALYAANHSPIFGYALRRTASWYVHDVAVWGGNQVVALIGRDKPAPGVTGAG
jgi:hypothetical protein